MGDKDSIEIDTEALGQYLDENFSELRARVLGVQTKISNAVNLLVDFQDQIKQKLEHLESAVMTLAQHVVPSEIPKATVKAAMTLIEDSTYAEQTWEEFSTTALFKNVFNNLQKRCRQLEEEAKGLCRFSDNCIRVHIRDLYRLYLSCCPFFLVFVFSL